MALKSMLPAKKESGENEGALIGKSEGSQPWGGKEQPPTLHLEGAHLGKLGLKKLPAVGTKLHIHAIAHVHSVHDEADDSKQPGEHEPDDASTGEDKKYNANRRMVLHIHHMDAQKHMGNEEDQKEESAKGAKAEMDKALSKAAGSESKKGGKSNATAAPRGGQG